MNKNRFVTKGLKWIGIVVFVLVVVVATWEQMRPSFVDWIDGEPIIAQFASTTAATDYELFVARQETQQQLRVMFESYEIDVAQKALDDAQEALERKKEELRDKELSLF